METKKKIAKNEVENPVLPIKDERDHIIGHQKYVIANQEMKLEVWRRLGKLIGSVSADNDTNNILIELREIGEI